MATPAFILALLLQASAALQEGRAHERAGRWDAAVASYAKVPDPPARPAAAAAEAWAERDRALEERWQAGYRTAVCLLRLDRPAEALVEFRAAGLRTPPPSLFSCGNAPAGRRARILAGEGACLERLGRHAEALDRYFDILKLHPLAVDRRIAPRIVALHRLAGREDALREELVRLDAAFLRKHPPKARAEPDLDLLRCSPTRPVRAVLEAETEKTDPGRLVVDGSEADVPFPPLPRTLTLP